MEALKERGIKSFAQVQRLWSYSPIFCSPVEVIFNITKKESIKVSFPLESK